MYVYMCTTQGMPSGPKRLLRVKRNSNKMKIRDCLC